MFSFGSLARCPDGFIAGLDGMKCYRVFEIKLPYSEAYEFCQNLNLNGNTLASIHSACENDFIKSLLPPNLDPYYAYWFIGGQSTKSEVQIDAWEYCRNLHLNGSSLISIHNAFENKFIENLLSINNTYYYVDYWLGGVSIANNSWFDGFAWYWEDGSDFNYQNFGNPDDQYPQALSEAIQISTNGVWSRSVLADYDDNNAPFICQVSATK
uniref:C-type lectin domain-containing protein n=1 Tax=Acrobeloides nanus TaxID=290746 RepID=A0A914CYM6_9BILA